MQEHSPFVIHKATIPFLNISMYLNGLSFIPSLSVENTSETDLGPLTVSIGADIPCMEDFSYTVAMMPAGKRVNIPLEGLKINRDFLDSLSETEKAVVKIELLEGETVLVSEELTILVHPMEHFGGFQLVPELIASYVTPNHPYVYHIKRKAVEILEQQGLQAAFEGYQANDPERVLQMMSAIFYAIRSEEIVYSALPPGYEVTGQRLRLLGTIQQEKFGNCIDMSLFLAACLEAIDLHPVLIVVRGHAFVGCWLRDDKFPTVINDDKAAITKRLAKGIREMAAVEATTLCKGSDLQFTDALNRGEAQLVEREHFILSVDIRRARAERIRPLPLRIDRSGEMEEEEGEKKSSTGMEDRFDIGTIYEDELQGARQPKTKQKVWERKLLDLSLRNNLLNIRMTRNMLQLVDIDISHLEDTLADGKSFSIMPEPRAPLLRKYNLFLAPLHHSSPHYQAANDELKHNRLLTYYHQEDLDSILSYMHKTARQAIEENGSSTLYLGVGLLKWYDRKTPEQPRYAPILLLPVELNRRSVNSRFTLKSREEETMINITLLEFLRQEYQLDLRALEQLPTDEKGVDVPKVMGILRRAVMQLKGWDVEEQLVLGNFSFSKLILWKDIVVHQEQLLKSDIVRSLIEGKLTLAASAGEGIGQPEDPDNIHPAAVALPIPADVFQMDAVIAAQKGRSFILHGPPGTGKSQTITNIIADALYQGKRVLFVAAKKAALDVVHRRLEQIGLAPFTLELHSNKSKKSDVLSQLARSLEAAERLRNSDFEQEARRLAEAKAALSSYVAALHQMQPAGLSLYDCITALEAYRGRSFATMYIPDNVYQALDAALRQQWEDWTAQYQAVAQLVSHPKENPFNQFRVTQYSGQIAEAIVRETDAFLSALPKVRQTLEAFSSAIFLPFAPQDVEGWRRIKELPALLEELPDAPVSLCLYLADRENKETLEAWSGHFTQYQAHLKELLDNYQRDVLSLDLHSIANEWKLAEQRWFLPRWLGKNKIRKQLSIYRNGKIDNDAQVTQLFTLHQKLKAVEQTLQQRQYEDIPKQLKSLYKGEVTDLLQITQLVNAVGHIAEGINVWGFNAFGQLMQIWTEKQVRYTSELIAKHKTLLGEVRRQVEVLDHHLLKYRELTGLDLSHLPAEGDWMAAVERQLGLIREHFPTLKDWMNYVHIRNKGQELHLHWLIAGFEEGLFSATDISEFFYYTLYASIARRVIARNETLNLFNAELYESRIAHYKKIAKDFSSLTRQELRLKLAARLPNTTVEAMHSSETGILQRAIRSKGRGLSIRKLFDQIPTLLPRIAPCMLMSPISVAQYFDVDTRHFDLVIFDEASQLPTCEAVSALARAKQAIIVGDPRQMPPTSFFSTNKIDEDNPEVEDLESILDDCLSLSVPSQYLLRHYRSRHESLIAFSNNHYYESKLLTFPSADDLNRKVVYHHVPGFYDKGKTRQNRFEAEEIVRYIREHYSHPKRSTMSLGVVTFNQTQQNLIEDKLRELFMQEPTLETRASEGDEPLFVKNLENVQGDERDIILFSIGYAPDEEGYMSMNFGPLNRDGGWRRLNVAVTRARNEMHVFATLRADQIDLGRTKAEGVAGLKAFLQFAEKGQLVVQSEALQMMRTGTHLSGFIAAKLEEKGLSVKCDVGTSGFKVDVGIIHPERSHEYILGVLIDGKYYFDARTTNDRELVLPSVLKDLGWHIYRIWTMDWYEHPDRIIEDIVSEVERLRTLPEETFVSDASAETASDEQVEAAAAPQPEPVGSGEQFNVDEDTELRSAPAAPDTAVAAPDRKQRPYTAHILLPVAGGSSETIFDFGNRKLVKSQIQAVVDAEAPVSKGLLYKRILQAWNVARAGSRLDKHLSGIIAEMGLLRTDHGQPFYWTGAITPANLDHYRANDIEKRSIEDIAPEELAVAIDEILFEHLSIEEEELLRYIARLFGFAKVGRQIDTTLRYVIDIMVQTGRLQRENGRVKVV